MKRAATMHVYISLPSTYVFKFHRMQDDENSTQLYQLKLEKCKRGNELSLLALTLAVYRSQVSKFPSSVYYYIFMHRIFIIHCKSFLSLVVNT